jgi:ATP-dependent protease ClpP protease subunit
LAVAEVTVVITTTSLPDLVDLEEAEVASVVLAEAASVAEVLAAAGSFTKDY